MLSRTYISSRKRKRLSPPPNIKLKKCNLNEFINQQAHKNITLSQMCGVWKVFNNEFIEQFTVSEHSALPATCQGKCCSHPCRSFDGDVKFIVNVDSKSVKWKTKPPYWFKNTNQIGYHLIVHQNGVVTFIPYSRCNFRETLSLARIDSNGWYDFTRNLIHAVRYGCFCFAIIEKDRNTLIFRRYNRWEDTNLSPYWIATKTLSTHSVRSTKNIQKTSASQKGQTSK